MKLYKVLYPSGKTQVITARNKRGVYKILNPRLYREMEDTSPIIIRLMSRRFK
jgi:hypothetical protein